MFKLRFKLLLNQMNTINRALKFLPFYSLNQLPFFPTRAEQNIQLRGQVFSTRFGAAIFPFVNKRCHF